MKAENCPKESHNDAQTNIQEHVRFEVFTAVTINIAFFDGGDTFLRNVESHKSDTP
jgi:hypothetical protein